MVAALHAIAVNADCIACHRIATIRFAFAVTTAHASVAASTMALTRHIGFRLAAGTRFLHGLAMTTRLKVPGRTHAARNHSTIYQRNRHHRPNHRRLKATTDQAIEEFASHKRTPVAQVRTPKFYGSLV
jgi:hypothetical protein